MRKQHLGYQKSINNLARLSILILSIVGSIDVFAASPYANYIVMADPQAWRSGQNSATHPNSEESKKAWKEFNHNVVNAIEKVYHQETATSGTPYFGIINGNITEFGRENTRQAFTSVYDNLPFPYYIGLGNYDYKNNVGNCRSMDELFLNPDACAYNMVKFLEQKIERYQGELLNFSYDKVKRTAVTHQGSLAYSWDHQAETTSGTITSHFVQLHLSPEYNVTIANVFNDDRYEIKASLSWLRQDLYHARKRSVDYIFVNLHAKDEYLQKASAVEKAYFQAILQEFKVNAVFAGHSHYPAVDRRNPLYGNVPVYTTGALHAGYFDRLQVNDKGFQVIRYRLSGDRPIASYGRREKRYAPPVWCKSPGEKGKTGDIYASNLFAKHADGSVGGTFLLKQQATGLALGVNKANEVATNPFKLASTYQKWQFHALNPEKPQYETLYKIVHDKDGAVLEGNSDGDIYTRKWSNGADQKWTLLKPEDNYIRLVNQGTSRILDADSRGNVYGSAHSPKYHNSYQKWGLVTLAGHEDTAIHYYKAKDNKAYLYPFIHANTDVNLPSSVNKRDEGKVAQDHWQYLGKRTLINPAPCLGW